MNDNKQPLFMILIGFVLVVMGVVFPLLMMMQMIESTFWLNFLAYGMQVAGLFMGIIGGATYINMHQEDDR